MLCASREPTKSERAHATQTYSNFIDTKNDYIKHNFNLEFWNLINFSTEADVFTACVKRASVSLPFTYCRHPKFRISRSRRVRVYVCAVVNVVSMHCNTEVIIYSRRAHTPPHWIGTESVNLVKTESFDWHCCWRLNRIRVFTAGGANRASGDDNWRPYRICQKAHLTPAHSKFDIAGNDSWFERPIQTVSHCSYILVFLQPPAVPQVYYYQTNERGCTTYLRCYEFWRFAAFKMIDDDFIRGRIDNSVKNETRNDFTS